MSKIPPVTPSQPFDITPPPKPKWPITKIVLYAVPICFIILLPILMYAVQRQQDIRSRATEEVRIYEVRVNPGVISLPSLNDKNNLPVYLSALAYDKYGQSISKGVAYTWGISSTNTIGTISLNSTTGDLATFRALNNGRGDLWVKAFHGSG